MHVLHLLPGDAPHHLGVLPAGSLLPTLALYLSSFRIMSPFEFLYVFSVLATENVLLEGSARKNRDNKTAMRV